MIVKAQHAYKGKTERMIDFWAHNRNPALICMHACMADKLLLRPSKLLHRSAD